MTHSSWPPLDRHEAGGLVGRESELRALEAAFTAAIQGRQRVVLIEGESGIGKSSLVEQFIADHPEALLLRSRCYEHQLLAYKAFDGAMESVARTLGRMPHAQQLLPQRTGLLCRLFPVLHPLEPTDPVSLHDPCADPSVQRLEAFAVFVRLIEALSERAPIVFAIDDLQWADAESFRLLQTWLRAGSSRCLLVATLRPQDQLEGEAAEGIAALRTLPNVEELPLQGLPRPSALRLAREAISRNVPDAWLEVMVQQSGGHPLFLTVLARFAQSDDPRVASQRTLDAALGTRIEALPSAARGLLDTVAVGGACMPAAVCGRAAGLEEPELGKLTTELCEERLLRRRRAGQLACFHDRIRKRALDALQPEQARRIHSAVATAMASQQRADQAELARHHEAAGELAPAYAAYRRAAEHALQRLAFARAVLFYTRALELGAQLQVGVAERSALQIACGHALGCMGRGADAARQYLQAAQSAQGTERLRLRLWAAQHLLQSACVQQGLAVACELLDELGAPMPESGPATVARLLWDRTCMAFGNLEVNPAPEGIEPEERLRLQAMWGLALPIGWLDVMAGAALSTRHARLARTLGEPAHLARALCEQAYSRVHENADDPAIDRLIARARALGERLEEPALDLCLDLREGSIAQVRWDLPRAQQLLSRALRMGAERCPTEPWLLTNARIDQGANWVFTGEHAQLFAASDQWLAEARARDDQFALALIEGVAGGHLRHLMADDPARARETLAAAMTPWPQEPFAYPHFGEMLGRVHIEQYCGGIQGHAWVEAQLPRLSRAMTFKPAFGRSALLTWRAATTLAAHAGARPEHQPRLLRLVHEHIRALRRLDLHVARLTALCFEAQLAALQQGPEAALARVQSARTQSEAAGWLWAARPLLFLEGLLEGGAGGDAKRRAALEFFASQGWKQPRRALVLMCPVLDSLASAPPPSLPPGGRMERRSGSLERAR